MTDSPGWYSQPFRPDGGITAEGLRNQLGRPSLSRLTVLVRESAQNSWDARVDPTVAYSLDLRRTSPAHMPAWRSLLLPGCPGAVDGLMSLSDVLRRPTLTYLAVSDRGTSGLDGPTRSDDFAEAGRRGWLSFVLNSGERQDTEGGGGTYGYGKGAFFLASRTGTVVIYTRYADATGVVRSRLIGSALLGSFHGEDRRPYTGRHWWGDPHEDHCEPLTGRTADDVARHLGLPPFVGQETGTTVVVLDPDLHDPGVPVEESTDMSLADAGRYLADAAAWNLWPITLRDRTQRLDVRVSADGIPVAPPDEESDPVLANFADAYRTAGSVSRRVELMCGNPKKVLGGFAATATFGAHHRSAAAAELGLETGASPHHIAVMRSPELVVQYVAGPEKMHAAAGYAGVFRVQEDLDDVFARAEPPTHDAWVDSQLSGREATFVRVARRRLNEQCQQLAGPRPAAVRVETTPVGMVAEHLGFLVAGVGRGSAVPGIDDTPSRSRPTSGGLAGDDRVGGARGAEERGEGGAPGRSAGPRTRLEGPPRYEQLDGTWVLVQPVRCSGSGRVGGRVSVITGDGSAETSAPVEAATPAVEGWRLPDGRYVVGDECDVQPGVFELVVTPVEDVAVQISVSAVEG